jgi:hypothetical protein
MEEAMKMPVRSATRLLSIAAASVCVLITPLPTASADPYTPVQTQDNAEFAIADGYIIKQGQCTPEVPAVFESITWNPPGFTPEGGSGMIHDANPSLGGPFLATWAGDYWNIEYQYC